MEYDSFFCFNSEDREWVKEIAKYLENNEKLRIWFDEKEIIPGVPLIPELCEGLEKAKTCVVFIGKNGEGSWQRSEIWVALIKQANNQNFRVIPVFLPDAPEKLTLPSFLYVNMRVDFRNKDYDEALKRLICGIRGIRPGVYHPKSYFHSSFTRTHSREVQNFDDIFQMRSLPSVGRVEAGTRNGECFCESEKSINVPVSPEYQQECYVAEVTGCSLEDAFILEGDQVVFEKIPNPKLNPPWDHLIIARLNGNFYIKRLIEGPDGQYPDWQFILHSENPKYDDIVVRANDEFYIEGKVIQLIRKYR